jgi:hypothetical protein
MAARHAFAVYPHVSVTDNPRPVGLLGGIDHLALLGEHRENF